MKAKEDGNTSWENINYRFQSYFHDRRFKVWFMSCTNDLHGFWRVGSTRFVVEFKGDKGYIRTCNDYDKYRQLPCWQARKVGEYYYVNWQSEVLI